MLKGAFKSMSHIHKFEELGDETVMTDIFEYESPLGFLGKIADVLFLKNYMTKFLTTRNQEIQKVAESEDWRLVLSHL